MECCLEGLEECRLEEFFCQTIELSSEDLCFLLDEEISHQISQNFLGSILENFVRRIS